MYASATAPTARGPLRLLRQIEYWLDQRGRWAWIAAMVAGFLVFAPIGLAILAYMIIGKRMFKSSCCRARHSDRHTERMAFWERRRDFGFRATGNQSFDSYRTETLRRLEEEQEAFESFLQRLRDARDKQEFDTFMDDRARAAAAAAQSAAEDSAAEPPVLKDTGPRN